MKNILSFICVLIVGLLSAQAQPNARLARQAAQQNNGPELSVRAQTKYPRSKSLPDDVIWMREIYRTLDVTKDPNGSLYYPVEPVGERVNLITLIFKLLAEKKIPAYEYMLDGTERLTGDYLVNFGEVLDRFQIYYEQRRMADRRDSLYIINDSDIPSPEVKSYFIKEVWYFDQRTSSYGSVVTALCPVMHRAEDFSSEELKLPMFWIDYTDLAPYLTRTYIMTSNLNNAANRSVDDFFVSRLYNGDIYKTTNMQDLILSQYCETDSAMVKEQKRIEAELVLFEEHLYGSDIVNKTDSIAPATKKQTKAQTKRKRESTNTNTTAVKSETTSNESRAPKASVRRQRR